MSYELLPRTVYKLPDTCPCEIQKQFSHVPDLQRQCLTITGAALACVSR